MELCNKNKVFEKSGGKKEGKITKIKNSSTSLTIHSYYCKHTRALGFGYFVRCI